MQKRTSVLGVAVSVGLVMGMLTMASGCVGPSESQEPAEESDGEMGTVSQAVNTKANCDYAAAGTGGLMNAHRRATNALKYIMGSNGVGECSGAVKTNLDTIRNAIANGDLTITDTRSDWICDTQRAKRITMKHKTLTTVKTEGTVWTAIHTLAVPGGQLDQCFGQGASTFFVLQTYAVAEAGKWRNYVQFDPEPANLVNQWGSTTASAAATLATGDAVTAFRFSATSNSSCGNAIGGSPCSSAGTTMSANAEVNQTVLKSGSFCKCPLPTP